MSNKKRYDKVSQLVQDVSKSKDFAEAFEQRLARRDLIKQLMILRVAQGLSQGDIAVAMDCTQSRVSKLESLEDGQLRMEDVVAYALALGLQTQVVLFKKDMTLADQVKCHFFETKALMERLAGMANVDPVIAKGIAGFFNEACVNFVTMLVENAKTLPPESHDDYPLVRMMSNGCKEKALADPTGSNTNGHHTNGATVPA